jgi:hypothetical protein
MFIAEKNNVLAALCAIGPRKRFAPNGSGTRTGRGEAGPFPAVPACRPRSGNVSSVQQKASSRMAIGSPFRPIDRRAQECQLSIFPHGEPWWPIRRSGHEDALSEWKNPGMFPCRVTQGFIDHEKDNTFGC